MIAITPKRKQTNNVPSVSSPPAERGTTHLSIEVVDPAVSAVDS
jgi:hypothetical protein